jgi:hypothetical protein
MPQPRNSFMPGRDRSRSAGAARRISKEPAANRQMTEVVSLVAVSPLDGGLHASLRLASFTNSNHSTQATPAPKLTSTSVACSGAK